MSLDFLSSSHLWTAFQFFLGGAVAGGFNFLVRLIREKIAARKAAAQTAAKEFEAALESDRLEVLGAYLRKHLGGIALHTYLTDTATAGRVNRYIERLSRFLEVPSGAAPVAQAELRVDLSSADAGVASPAPVAEAFQLLESGNTWTALAILRRDLETRLRTDVPEDIARRSPPYLRVEDKRMREAIRRFWHTASRAIHGDDVSNEEAWNAIYLAKDIYLTLAKQNQVGFTDIAATA